MGVEVLHGFLHVKELSPIYCTRLLVVVHFEMEFSLLLLDDAGMGWSDLIHLFFLLLFFLLVTVSCSALLQQSVLVV
jgi:hypothetical protein